MLPVVVPVVVPGREILLDDPDEVVVLDELVEDPAEAVLLRLAWPGRLDRLLEERVVLYGDVDEDDDEEL